MLALLTVAAALVVAALTWTVDLDPFVVAIIAGPVVTLLTGLITKLDASSGLKRVVAMALSAIAGVLAQIVAADGNLDIGPIIESALLAFGSSVVAYYMALRPTGLSPKVNGATSDFGLGAGSG